MLLIKNGLVKTMAGPTIPHGSVLIGDDGRIAAVGPELMAPAGCTVVDAGGRLVTPGCVDAHCHVGVDDECMGWEGEDYNEMSDPVTPHLRAIDAIYPQDEGFALALQGGVTSACTGPGSANVVGGTFAAIKLSGDRVDDMIIKDPAAMKCAFGENPKRIYGQGRKASPVSRMGTAALLRELLFRTRRYIEDKEAGKTPAFDMKLEAMIPVLKGEIPLKCHVHRADDILTAVRIGNEFGVKVTLDHCTDGNIIAHHLAEEGKPCFVGPSLGGKTKIELMSKSFTTPGVLSRAGVKVSIITDAPVIPLQYLPLCAALACKAGLDEEEAWRAITINPAVSTGIGDRVGSLEPGKDGDVVIWTDDPMHEVGAEAFVTVVNGKIVYRK